jgi:cobalt/nickel transport system permease protein
MSLQIDLLAYSNRLRYLPPEHKLSFALLLMAFSYGVTAPFQVGIALWLLVWTVGYAGIDLLTYSRLLLVPLGFWLLSLPALLVEVTFDAASASPASPWPAVAVGPLYLYLSTLGIHQAGSLLPRILALTTCLYFLLLTTPFPELLQVLGRWRCPVLITELLLLIYRFIFVLLETALELLTAQQTRLGYATWKIGMNSLGLLVGQLLWRTLENYRQISLSMASRGFTGSLRLWQPRRYRPSWRYGLEAGIGCFVLAVHLGWRYAARI